MQMWKKNEKKKKEGKKQTSKKRSGYINVFTPVQTRQIAFKTFISLSVDLQTCTGKAGSISTKESFSPDLPCTNASSWRSYQVAALDGRGLRRRDSAWHVLGRPQWQESIHWNPRVSVVWANQAADCVGKTVALSCLSLWMQHGFAVTLYGVVNLLPRGMSGWGICWGIVFTWFAVRSCRIFNRMQTVLPGTHTRKAAYVRRMKRFREQSTTPDYADARFIINFLSWPFEFCICAVREG